MKELWYRFRLLLRGIKTVLFVLFLVLFTGLFIFSPEILSERILDAGKLVLPSIAIIMAVHHFKVQHQLKFFSDFTKRYQEAILLLPSNVNDKNFELELEDDKCTKEKTLKAMQVYFDLCYEEWSLYQQKRISKEAWSQWESGMQSAFRKKAFKDCWKILREREIDFSESFIKFVESNMGFKEDISIIEPESRIQKSTSLLYVCFFTLFIFWIIPKIQNFSLGSFANVEAFLFISGFITLFVCLKNKRHKIAR